MYKKNNIKFVANYENAILYDVMPNISNSLVNYLVENIIKKDDILVDVGCGTGRLTKELLRNGNLVYGVEPDEDMIKVCEDNLCKYNNFHMIKGCDSNTNLPDNSVDCVFVSQSLHRFNTKLFQKECDRILKNKRNICVMWNRVHFGKPIFKELLIALKSSYPNYKSRYDEMDEINGCIYEMDANLLDAKDLIGKNMESKFFKNYREYNHKEFRDLVLSLGIFPLDDNSHNSKLLSSEIDVEKFIKMIDKIFYKYANRDKIILPFESDLHYLRG